ncbi:hypothetical protein ACN27G_22640 [Plantactinospora sp. WMMB334]|uniref:hypothetical protein n=1 Tax=Plantactinospora sp. WMMB334 TaxID=3404119 RepID=UPI003B9450A8
MRIAVLVALTVAVVVAVVVGLALWRRPPRNGSLTLVLAALTIVVAVSIATLPLLIDDGGASGAAVAIVPPVVVTGLAALVAWRWQTAGLVVTWLATILMGAYVLVFSLGLGLFYAPAALLLLAAALTGSARAAGLTRNAGQPV